MLTEKQYKLLLIIDDYKKTKGYSPSCRELQVLMEMKSTSGIIPLLCALEERKFIKRLKNRARAIDILKMPEVDNGDS